ncbi:MAG: tetratricopeptide repeat protein [Verrucomicrobia bacterium]|nr:MAG: tetratricopeptide repeat protein [Verrucomicrobiota bacterium]
MDSESNRQWRWAAALALAVITLAVYAPVAGFGFVTYDDEAYVQLNPHVQGGVSWEKIGWAFTHSYAANWHPLTWISHMLDCQFFGNDAGAHHLVNVALHTANALLLFLLLLRLTRAEWPSLAVAALFALHPAHVESVAWISERKDVLSTFFVLLALGAHVRCVTSDGWRVTSDAAISSPVTRHPSRHYWLALLFFALSLLSKGMYVTLPFVLLLLDYWPLGRISPKSEVQSLKSKVQSPASEDDAGVFDSQLSTFNSQLSRWRPFLVEKIPFFLLSLAASIATFVAQKTGGAVVEVTSLSLSARLANAVVAYARYLGHLFWPVDLAAIYPLPKAWPGWQIGGAVLLLVAISFVVVKAARTRPFLPVGWAWFLGTLVPVVGLVQVGSTSMADRYTYFSYIGLFIALVWLAAEWFARHRAARVPGGIAALLLLVACAWLTSRQIGFWSDSYALFNRAVTVTRDNAQAHCNLGYLYEADNQLERARTNYAEAVRLNPRDPESRMSLGVVLARLGQTNLAREHLDLSMGWQLDTLRDHPKSAKAFNSLGVALSALGEFADAVDAYAKAASLDPEDFVFRNNLGVAFARTGDLNKAIATHREVTRRNPNFAKAWCNLGAELVTAGQIEEAIPCLERAVQLDAKYAEAWSNLGGALARRGDHATAIQSYETALQLDPKLGKAHLNLGLSLQKLGRLDDALQHFREAVRLEPANQDARYNLGRSLLLRGDAAGAATELETLLKTSPENAPGHLYLGQACAALRQFDCALMHLREALRLRPEWPEAAGALAWNLATAPEPQFRNGDEAVALVEKISRVTDARQPALLDALAAAYAETGRFDDAVSAAQQALAAAKQLGQTDLAARLEQRIALYQSHQPFRQ